MEQNNSANDPVTLGNPTSSGGTPVVQAIPAAQSKFNLPQTSLAGMYVTSPSSGGRRVFDGGISVFMNYIAIIISLAVTAALIFFVIVPQYRVYVENQSKILQTKADLDKVTAHHNYLKDLESLQAKFYTNIDMAKQAIPEEEDVPQFLNQVSITSKEVGLVVNTNTFKGTTKQVVPEDPAALINAGVISVNTSITGRYDEFIKLMELLENARRLVSVDEIRMSILSEAETKKYLEKVELNEKRTTEEVDNSGISPDTGETGENQIGKAYFDLTLSLTGYHLKDPDISKLTVDQLVSKRNPSNAIDRLLEMQHYELSDIVTETGRDNPFMDNEAQTVDDGTTPQP